MKKNFQSLTSSGPELQQWSRAKGTNAGLKAEVKPLERLLKRARTEADDEAIYLVLHSLLNSYCRHGESDLAIEILREMDKFNPAPILNDEDAIARTLLRMPGGAVLAEQYIQRGLEASRSETDIVERYVLERTLLTLQLSAVTLRDASEAEIRKVAERVSDLVGVRLRYEEYLIDTLERLQVRPDIAPQYLRDIVAELWADIAKHQRLLHGRYQEQVLRVEALWIKMGGELTALNGESENSMRDEPSQ